MFLGQWGSIEDLINDFNDYDGQDTTQYEGIEILLAYYLYECYGGYAFVLFRKDGELYEVNGSHCSCYGLEGQWEPEETTVEALRHRLEADKHFGAEWSGNKDYYSNTFRAELKEVLDSLS